MRLNGQINLDLLLDFQRQLAELIETDDDLVLELATNGGEPDIARRIATEIKLFQSLLARNAVCVAKTQVYSAGITIIGAFPRDRRFATSDTTFLVHERHIVDTIGLNGPTLACAQIVREKLAMLETAHRLEREDLASFVEGSELSLDELYDRSKENCYIGADDALHFGLIAGII